VLVNLLLAIERPTARHQRIQQGRSPHYIHRPDRGYNSHEVMA